MLITSNFLDEHEFEHDHVSDHVRLEEESGEHLRGFLQLMFGLMRDEVKRVVVRSQSRPHSFFISEVNFNQMLNRRRIL